MTLTLDFQGQILKMLYLRNGRVDSLRMKGMWVGYDVGCTMVLTLGRGAWQINRPSNESMWNCYSFQPVAQWMGYSFTDLGLRGVVVLWTPCYDEYDITNSEKHVSWAQRSLQNHHQMFHNRCPEKIGPLPKKSDHWFSRTCPENTWGHQSG